MYLSQSYFEIPLLIRQQVRYLMLFELGDDNNLKQIIRRINRNILKGVVQKIIENACAKEFSMCFIDLQQRDINKKFRRNFVNIKTNKVEYYKIKNDDGSNIPLDEIVLYK